MASYAYDSNSTYSRDKRKHVQSRMCSCKWVQILKKLILTLFLIVLLSNLGVAFALPQTDPAGDCFSLDQEWSAGNPVPCEPSGDITQIELVNNGRGYLVTITVAGRIPSQLDSYTMIEWDLLIDADRNNLTAPWEGAGTATGMWLANGLGVDYMVIYMMNGNSPGSAQIWDGSTKTTHTTPVQINGDEIAMTFLPSDISGSSDFYFLVLVRMYVEDNSGGYLTLFDEAPNTGYYEFKAGSVTGIPEFLGKQQVVSMIILAIGVTVLSRRRKTVQCQKGST